MPTGIESRSDGRDPDNVVTVWRKGPREMKSILLELTSPSTRPT